MSDRPVPEEEPVDGVPGAPGGDSSAGPDRTPIAGTPDGEGLPSDAAAGGVVSRWRRTYGASPLHLLLHLAAIALIAWALSQSFDARYEKAYLNLAIWMVGGAVLNDFVALPIYVGLDKAARAVWGRIAGTGTTARPRRAPAVLGNGHVRFPLVMSGVLLLVYFPNIMHKAPIGHRLSTGLAEQPDWAGRWLAITAGLLIGSAVLYALRVALHRRRAGRASPTASA